MSLSSNGANQLFVYLTAPRVLAHMPAWSASLITQVRTLPASLEYKCVRVWIGGWACERMRVCASICYNRGASCDRSPLTSALGEGACSCICGLLLLQTTDVACVRMHPPMIMYRFLCLHEAPYVCVYLSKKCLTPVLWRHPSPSFLPVIFFGTRWGARVTSDPLLHCDWRDRPDSPPPCYCTLMGIWHYSDPFINRATTTHLSFPSSLISVPISVIL